MPYIDKSFRKDMDEVVKLMIDKDVKADGKLNYILYKFCKDTVTPSYNNYKNYLGELQEAICEIRRRLLSKYEDLKTIENGDVE
jgi:hypothetical protein